MKTRYEYAPIVLFVYNRPNHTKETIECLKKCKEAKDSELYIIADGAKNEEDSVRKTRDYCDTIEGFKTITVEKREENWGIEASMIEAITRIVNIYGKIIVIEDDICVNPGFLSYMNEALQMYVENKEVFYIGGYMYTQLPNKLPETMLLRMPSTWGWATWKDRWDKFNTNLSECVVKKICNSKMNAWRYSFDGADLSWATMLKSQCDNKTYTWDVAWAYILYINNGLVLLPRNSLVTNIGFDGSGVHIKNNNKDVVIDKKKIEINYYPKVIKEKWINRKIVSYYVRLSSNGNENSIIRLIKFYLYYWFVS